MADNSTDTPTFTSGEWNGFYLEKHNTNRGWMHLYLEIEDQTIKGEGTDYVGPWNLSGTYERNHEAKKSRNTTASWLPVTSSGELTNSMRWLGSLPGRPSMSSESSSRKQQATQSRCYSSDVKLKRIPHYLETPVSFKLACLFGRIVLISSTGMVA